MAKAVGIIQAEHRGYGAVLHCLDHLVQDIETRGLEPDFELLHLLVAYIREFLDRFHHPKEDSYLFKALRLRCPEAGAVLDRLEEEHEKGPILIAALARALDDYEREGDAAFPNFRRTVTDYVAFERDHVKREEAEVLPLARQHLTEADWQPIDAAFTANEDPMFGVVPKQRFRRLFSTIVAMAPPPYGFGHHPHTG
jgi:branched-chain amino acid transport system ATP-binding protein